MSEPSREHIEAVARGLQRGKPKRPSRFGLDDYRAEVDATMLLTSTDPAVLDAMQDALVRAGRLWEEKGVYAWGTDDERNETRFITEWQEIES